MLKPGDRVEFLKSSRLYQHGLRTGRIVSLTETGRQAFERRFKECDLPAEAIKELLSVPMPGDFEKSVPVVALDAVAALPDMPQGFQATVLESQMRALPAEAGE
jgi:hypothetical protein